MGQKFPWEKRSHGKEIPNLFLYAGGSDSQEPGGTFTRPGMGITGSGCQAFVPCGLLDKVSGGPMIEGMGDVSVSEPMRGNRGGDPGSLSGGMDNPVDGGLIEKATLL